MGFMLGNLNETEMANKLGIEFPEELLAYLADKRQHLAEKIEKGKWHCFDVPFVIVCGDMETAKTIHEFLKPFAFANQLKCQITIAIDE